MVRATRRTVASKVRYDSSDTLARYCYDRPSVRNTPLLPAGRVTWPARNGPDSLPNRARPAHPIRTRSVRPHVGRVELACTRCRSADTSGSENTEIPESHRSSHAGMQAAIQLYMRRADHLLTPLADTFETWDAVRASAMLIMLIALVLVLSLRV